MAYGLIYNLNFASNLEGNRKNRLSIYKDGHTATITTSDNNIIGSKEPVILIWDNSDDIYNNIMSSRLEMNFLSDDVKQIDIEDILDNTTPSKYKVEYHIENASGVLVKYWEGYLSNATYRQDISSTPVAYKLIATDLLTTLKNILTTDGTAVIDNQPTVIKYFQNVFGFLPQSFSWRISNDIQIKQFRFPTPLPFTKLHLVEWLFPYTNGFSLLANNAMEYVTNTLKVIHSRLFYANDSWYIINNSTYKDSASFDLFNSSGNYSSTYSFSSVKTIPTDFKPINNDLSIRYDTPIDSVQITAKRNEYTTDFDDINSYVLTSNLTPYPSFETKVNGILYNSTYYSDNFTSIQDQPVVKKGNYAIKTTNFITSGLPTQKIMDTGFVGDFRTNVSIPPTLFISYYIQNSIFNTKDFYIYYSLVREISTDDSGTSVTRQYWNNGWVTYTNESSIVKLEERNSTANTNQWVEFKTTLDNHVQTQGYARYRIILYQPKLIGSDSIDVIINFDEVLLNQYNTIESTTDVKTVSKIQGSTRRNKNITIDFQHFHQVGYYETEFQTDDITFTGIPGSTELNSIIAQQILNDNRKHIKRYSVSVVPNTFDDILYPYHKINVDFSNFESDDSCIIDRMRYNAKSGFYELEFHETNQSTNVTLNTTILAKESPFVTF